MTMHVGCTLETSKYTRTIFFVFNFIIITAMEIEFFERSRGNAPTRTNLCNNFSRRHSSDGRCAINCISLGSVYDRIDRYYREFEGVLLWSKRYEVFDIGMRSEGLVDWIYTQVSFYADDTFQRLVSSAFSTIQKRTKKIWN